MKKFFVLLLTIFVTIFVLWLQVNLFNYYKLFGVIPNIGIVLIVAISMCAGQNIGGIIGLLYGVLFDSCFNTSFGLYTFMFCVIGYGVGLIKGKLALDNKLSLFIIVAISTLLLEIINIIFLSIKNISFDISALYIFKVIVLEIIYNVFLTFISYKPLMFLGDIINRSRRAYYEL